MISFFDTGTWVDGADYWYTPEHRETRKRLENQKRIQINEETQEEEIIFEDVEIEEEVIIPAKWRPDCVHVEYVDLPQGKKPILKKTKKWFCVEFEDIEQNPPTITSDNETV